MKDTTIKELQIIWQRLDDMPQENMDYIWHMMKAHAEYVGDPIKCDDEDKVMNYINTTGAFNNESTFVRDFKMYYHDWSVDGMD